VDEFQGFDEFADIVESDGRRELLRPCMKYGSKVNTYDENHKEF